MNAANGFNYCEGFILRLMREEHSKFFAYLLKLCNGNYRLAEELMQEFYIKVIRRCAYFKQLYLDKKRGKFFVTLRNTFLDYQRRQKRYRELLDNLRDNLPPSSDQKIEDHDPDHQPTRTFEEYCEDLSEKDCLIIQLYLAGYPHKEIGEVVELSEGAVSARICRIKEKLRNRWKK